MSAEEWRPIPGFDGYDASDRGRIRSRRKYQGKPGPRLLSPAPGWGGYSRVNLRTADGPGVVMRVHAVVLLAFVGPRPDGAVVRHLDGNPNNNALSNLCYGTASENLRDQVAHGTHTFANRTHCPHGHEYTAQNTYVIPATGSRTCRTCSRRREREYRSRLELARTG